MSEYYFFNGQLEDNRLFNRALFFGEGVFETFRWKGKPPVLLSTHLERLKQSSSLFGIPYPGDPILIQHVQNSVKESTHDDAYVKLCLVSEGKADFSSMPEGCSVLVVVKKQPETKNEYSLCVSKIKRNQNSPLNTVKSFNYMENIMAKRNAIQKGFEDAIFLNINDEIVETSSCNIFWVRGKSLFTPSLNCGLLPGTTRELVLEVARESGYQVNERKYKLPYLLNSDFAFLTNASSGCIYVNRINNQQMPSQGKEYGMFKEMLFEKLEWV